MAFLGLVFILVSLLAFLVFARSVFGWVARAEGYSLTVETTVHDNPAVGVRFGLFRSPLRAARIPAALSSPTKGRGTIRRCSNGRMARPGDSIRGAARITAAPV